MNLMSTYFQLKYATYVLLNFLEAIDGMSAENRSVEEKILMNGRGL